MREIKITQGYIAFCDDEDYDMLNKFSWMIVKKREQRYARAWVNGKQKRMHQLIYPNNYIIDHINLNGLDNRKENLRICSNRENLLNTPKPKGKRKYSSSYKGISKIKSGKYLVRISTKDGPKSLGIFDDEKKAALEYNKHLQKFHGDFKFPNKI